MGSHFHDNCERIKNLGKMHALTNMVQQTATTLEKKLLLWGASSRAQRRGCIVPSSLNISTVYLSLPSNYAPTCVGRKRWSIYNPKGALICAL